jgi:hypothetical protein
MAKYTITYSCGHTGEIQLFGKMDERDRKIAWLEREGLCPECYKARKEQEHAEATEKAKQETADLDLPELTGSERQIAWAETIRAKAAKIDIPDFHAELANAYHALTTDAEAKAKIDARLAALPSGEEGVRILMGWHTDQVRKHTDAHWWIEKRGCTGCGITKEMMAEWAK